MTNRRVQHGSANARRAGHTSANQVAWSATARPGKVALLVFPAPNLSQSVGGSLNVRAPELTNIAASAGAKPKPK